MKMKKREDYIDDADFWRAFDSLKQKASQQPIEERERQIKLIAEGCRAGALTMTAAALVSAAIDNKNFKQILEEHLPGFDSFITGVMVKTQRSRSRSRGFIE